MATLVAVASISMACNATPAGTYFNFGDPIGESGPVPPGATAYVGLPGIEVAGKDRVRFRSVVMSGIGDVAFSSQIARLSETSGQMVVLAAEQLPSGELDHYQPLGASDFTSSDGPLGILLSFPMPGNDLTLHDIQLVYSVDGGAEVGQTMPLTVHVCASPMLTPCSLP